MGVNKVALKAPSGLLKVLALALCIVVLLLARIGHKGKNEVLVSSVDERWLTIGTTVGYTIILGTMILTYLLGSGIPDKMELIFQFVGCVLFLATGGVTIDTFQNAAAGAHKDAALAMGSMAIITGIVLFLDCLIIGKALKNRT